MAKRAKRKSLKRRIAGVVIWCLLIVLLVPLVLAAAYRYVPPPLTPLMVIRLFEGEGINKNWKLKDHALQPGRDYSPREAVEAIWLEKTKGKR